MPFTPIAYTPHPPFPGEMYFPTNLVSTLYRRRKIPKTPLQPSSVAVPKNPYSPGVKQGRFVFTSGQIPLDTRGNLVGLGDVPAQTDQVMKNVQAVLAEGGAMMEDVI